MESNINYIWGLLIRNIEWSRKIIQPGCSPGMGLKIREKNSINFSLPSIPSLPFIIDSTRGLMMRSDLSGWEDSLEGGPGRADRCCLCWRAERPGLTGAGCQSHRSPGGGGGAGSLTTHWVTLSLLRQQKLFHHGRFSWWFRPELLHLKTEK